MKVFECEYTPWGCSLLNARIASDDELRERNFNEWCFGRTIVVVGDWIGLDFVPWNDPTVESICNSGRKRYGFLSGSSSAVEISEAEWEALLRLNLEYKREKERARKNERIAVLRKVIEKANRQKTIPPREIAEMEMKRYNDINNDGGYGFVPYIISAEEYEAAKNELARLNNDEI